MLISVIGASSPTPEVEALAEKVGAELARRGMSVVCGGLEGVMEAVCRGAKSEGGLTVGILPGSDPSRANPWVDVPICTGLGHARNVVVVRAGRTTIAIGGAFGTLSEIGFALSEHIPVIGLNTWSVSQNGQSDKTIVVAADPVDAVEKAIRAANARTPVSSAALGDPS